jgi:pimeloyl-ACP methyl ester carboxylesterase
MTYAIEGTVHQLVDTGEATLSVYEAGEGPAVVFCHGFPELAYSWRRQLPVVAAAGFRAIAPDMRGYGGSARPPATTDYDMAHLTGDLVALLDQLDIERAVFVGHDWGGLVVWQMPLLHPDRVAGVVGVNTPFIPRLPMPPIEVFRLLSGEDNYIVRFQEADVPEEMLSRDIPNLFMSMMRSGVSPDQVAEAAAAMTEGSSFEKLMGGPKLGEALLDDDELAVYVDAFTETGFTGGLNWYRNFDRNWAATPEQDGAHIDGLPCLMVVAEWDPVLVPALSEGMPDLIDDLEMRQLDHCGHWTPSERPDDLNALLVDWLTRRFSA